MKYQIVLAEQAVEDFRRLSARDRSTIREALERHLRDQPAKESRSGIKRLRGIVRPQYRLRVGDFRVFYDVVEDAVEVLTIVPKVRADEWLKGIGGQS
jgi:mRNA-degrading endonuclease RelE of RelBE toxin-antitoxin system